MEKLNMEMEGEGNNIYPRNFIWLSNVTNLWGLNLDMEDSVNVLPKVIYLAVQEVG